jgi:hypothetical protein
VGWRRHERPGRVTIIDNSKEEHDTEKSLDKTTKQQFKLKQREGTHNWIIIMRVQADMSLLVMKNHDEVYDLLNQEKYKVLLHKKHIFPEPDWNIAKLGMLHNIHVAHVLKETVTSHIRIDSYG